MNNRHIQERADMSEETKQSEPMVLDPPMAPDMKSKTKRAQMVVGAFIMSLFFGVFVVLFKEYLKKIKAKSDGLVKSPNIVIPAGLCPFGVYPEHIEITGFPRIGYGAGLVKSGMTKQGFTDFLRFHQICRRAS